MGKVEDELKEVLYSACCTIQVDKQVIGTGWVASKCCIISAGHIFAEIRKDASIKAQFTNNYECNLVIDRCEYYRDPLIDYAILRPCFGEVSIMPLKISESYSLSGKFLTCGYGRTLAALSHAEGRIIGFGGKTENKRLLKLSSSQCGDFGYSGSPIYSIGDDAVIAIQSETSKQDIGAERDTIIAYPLRNFWRELNQSLKHSSAADFEDPLGLMCVVFATEFDRAMAYCKGGDKMCETGQFATAIRYYDIAEKIFRIETGTASKYVRNISRKIQRAKNRGVGEI